MWPTWLADNHEDVMMVLTATGSDDNLGLLLQRVDVLLVEHQLRTSAAQLRERTAQVVKRST